jgi:glycosyltransferase involved in cell wall biosynthesis
MCAAFANNGHETVLIARRYNDSQTDDIYDYYGVDNNFRLTTIRAVRMKGIALLLLPKLWRKLRQHNPKDVLIYARDIYGASLAVQMGFRVVYESHGLPYNKLIDRLEQCLFKSARFVKLIVISEALKKLYISRTKKLTEIKVCHDAADIPSPHKQIDYPWPSKRDTLQIGYVGHLYRGRGIDIIIQCAMRLPQYDFHIVGGEEKDIAYWKQHKIQNLYFHGFVKPRMTTCICRECDILLMPYQMELTIANKDLNTSSWMSPLKLFEYMSAGRTIIASALPVVREVLNIDNSILVQPNNVDEWVNAIRKCENRECRGHLAQQAYESFLKYHTWEKRAKTVLKGIKL